MDGDWDVDAPADDGNPVGTPEAELHWSVDVSDFVDTKRAALACHASQSDASRHPADAAGGVRGGVQPRVLPRTHGRAPGMWRDGRSER